MRNISMNPPGMPYSPVQQKGNDIIIFIDKAPLRPVDLDDADNVLPTDWTDFHLACAGDTGTDVATVIEQGILLFAVTDLTEIHFFIGYFPVADTFPMTFTIFVTAHILVACLLLDEGALAMALIFEPISVIGVANRILQESLTMTLSEDEISIVGSG